MILLYEGQELMSALYDEHFAPLDENLRAIQTIEEAWDDLSVSVNIKPRNYDGIVEKLFALGQAIVKVGYEQYFQKFQGYVEDPYGIGAAEVIRRAFPAKSKDELRCLLGKPTIRESLAFFEDRWFLGQILEKLYEQYPSPVPSRTVERTSKISAEPKSDEGESSLQFGQPVATDMKAGHSSGTADMTRSSSANGANTSKLFLGDVPENSDIRDLIVKLDADSGSGKSFSETAREFTGETMDDFPKADSLLTQIRRLRRTGKVSL